MRIELLHVPDCPLVDQVRIRVRECLEQTGVRVPIEEAEGAYPSPTLLIDGLDVATGQPAVGSVCCRLDLPTDAQILAALHENMP